MKEKNLTGYPSIDKPWLKYYGEEAISGTVPKKKLYNYIFDIIKLHPNCDCFEYFGKRVTCKLLIENIEKTAKAFLATGVNPNDIVSIISPTTLESIYCVYALNRIGAISNIIDPRLSVENIEEKTEHSTLIVALDLVRPKLDKLSRHDQTVVYFSVMESLNFLLKVAYKIKSHPPKVEDSPRCLRWKSFLETGTKVENVLDTPYQENTVAVIVSTSGTTGKSKLAQLTNENLNAVAWQYEHSGISHQLGETFLDVMPIFLSYGIATGVHMPLALGFKTVIIPQRDLSKMGKYLINYRPTSYNDNPGGYEALLNSKSIKPGTDLSFLKHPGVGGDHMNIELEKAVNEFLKAHNSDSQIQKGYGMTEMASAAVVNVSSKCNSLGSVGVPFPKTLAKVVKTGTKEEAGYNEVGELYLSGPTVFAGYLDDAMATEQEMEIDEQKTKWIKTGDLFSFNKKGELFFHGRIKAMFVRPDGHNNYPHTMNELILTHPAVADCYTVGVSSPYHIQGKYPKSVVVLKSEYKGKESIVQKELEKMCMERFSQRDVPYFYEFRDSLPYTPNGKVDFRCLEEGIENASMAEILKKEQGV